MLKAHPHWLIISSISNTLNILYLQLACTGSSCLCRTTDTGPPVPWPIKPVFTQRPSITRGLGLSAYVTGLRGLQRERGLGTEQLVPAVPLNARVTSKSSWASPPELFYWVLATREVLKSFKVLKIILDSLTFHRVAWLRRDKFVS